MASNQSKKKVSGARNPERRNGKAWKQDKNKQPKRKTQERQLKDFEIRRDRDRRREEGMARHQAEKERFAQEMAEMKAEREALIQAEIQAQKEAREKQGIFANVPKQQKRKPTRKREMEPAEELLHELFSPIFLAG